MDSVDLCVEREIFFYNQVRKDHETVYTGKSFRQIRDPPDSYIVQGGLEIGQGDRTPLWLFGFLY